MRCPRCKGENTEDAVICSNCKLKLKSPCPRCKSLNRIGQSVCSNCNLKLIRFCPQCKAPNFPNAPQCRKCGFQLLKPRIMPAPPVKEILPPPQKPHIIEESPKIKKEHAEEISNKEDLKQETDRKFYQEDNISPPEIDVEPTFPKEQIQPQIPEQKQSKPSETKQPEKAEDITKQKKTYGQVLSRTKAHESIISKLKTAEEGLIFDVSAINGGGKSTLISSVTQTLKEEKIIWLIGICQPINQILPYSFFQDMFKTFLGLPLFISNVDESRKTLQKLLENSLDIKDPTLHNILSRILFNDFTGVSHSILENKEEIHDAICKFMDLLSQKATITIIIEDFEYIDSASLDCFKVLLDRGFLNKKNFIMVNHQPNIDLHDILPMESLKKKIFSLSLESMTTEELNSSLIGMLNNQDIIPEKIKNKIFEYSKDTPLYMEQVLWYLFQTGALLSTETALTFNTQAANIEIPTSIEELMSARLKLISTNSPDAIKVVASASLFGVKFVPPFVQVISKQEEKQFNYIMQMLINSGIFVLVDQTSLRFKHGLIWQTVYEQYFTDEEIVNSGIQLLDFYGKYTVNTSNAILARHAEEANLPKETYYYSDIAAKECLYLGDVGSFTDFQNKVLELLPEIELPEEEKNHIKINIEEQLGRANFELNPQIAMEFLSNSILQAEKDGNAVKIIDLTGYLARSCEIAGNFSGVIECCDKALSLIDTSKYKFESVLLNYYKLESTFNLGRLEETIVNAVNEVIPDLNNFISRNKTIKGLNISDLNTISYEAEITLAKAFAYQGNKQVIELTTSIATRAQRDNLPKFEMQALLIQALYLTVQGNTKGANSVLTSLKEKFPDDQTPDKFKLYWYLIAIISNLTSGHFEQTKELCEIAITMAHHFKEYNILTILRLILGKCYEELGRIQEAQTLYDETVHYCSENKMATGALFSWYLASNMELKGGDQERAFEIAERALEIAQKPNITNQLIEILLHNLIAKIRTKKGDFEGARIDIETAINIAEKYDLTLFLVGLYHTFGDVFWLSISNKLNNAVDNANVANRLYTKALLFAEQIDNHYLISSSDRILSQLHTYCRQSAIKLESVT